MKNLKNTERGFTLIELLIVIGIIGFLAAAVLVAVDPVKRIQDARDARRYSEANALLNAILNKQVDARALYDGDGIAPIITHATNSQVIISGTPGAGDCAAAGTAPLCPTQTLSALTEDCEADLGSLAPDYIAAIPLDPGGATPGTGPAIGANNSGYYIHRTTGDRIEIGSCWPEQAAAISVKR